jgi:hypothetical protein
MMFTWAGRSPGQRNKDKERQTNKNRERERECVREIKIV